MDDRALREPAVFVVTVRTGGTDGEMRGSIVPVLEAGAAPTPRRWFQALEQIPAIIRSFLARQGGTEPETDNRRP